jgi:hypothetical protein
MSSHHGARYTFCSPYSHGHESGANRSEPDAHTHIRHDQHGHEGEGIGALSPSSRRRDAYMGLQSLEVLTDMSSAMIRPYMPSADAVPWMSTMPT